MQCLRAALGREAPRREKSIGVVAGFSGSMSGMGPKLPTIEVDNPHLMTSHDLLRLPTDTTSVHLTGLHRTP